MIGTTIKGYYDGVEVISRTDATYASGSAGIWAFGTADAGDDWEGENVGGGAATAYIFTGPTSGTVNGASTNFTITPNGTFTGTITPATDGSGSFTPSSLTWTAESGGKTCTYTPTSTAGSPHTLSTSDNGGLTDPATIDYTVNASTPAAGTISFTSSSPSGIQLSCSAASGGTPSYTYQWYRSVDSGFTPGGGNILSGATSLSLTDSTAVDAPVYFYKVVVTDSAAGTSTTAQFAASLYAATIKLAFVGDSITSTAVGGYTPAESCARRLRVSHGVRTVSITNSAGSGLASNNWASGSTLTNAVAAAVRTDRQITSRSQHWGVTT